METSSDKHLHVPKGSSPYLTQNCTCVILLLVLFFYYNYSSRQSSLFFHSCSLDYLFDCCKSHRLLLKKLNYITTSYLGKRRVGLQYIFIVSEGVAKLPTLSCPWQNSEPLIQARGGRLRLRLHGACARRRCAFDSSSWTGGRGGPQAAGKSCIAERRVLAGRQEEERA